LRNHYREHFFTQDEITPAQQEAWWYAAKYGDQRWVIEEGTNPIGYFSIIAPKPDLPVFPSERPVYYFNSMMVDPDHRGRGAILAARDAFDPALSYVGYVKVDNTASLRACIKLGFEHRGVYHHPTYGFIAIVWRN
jgi:RimJ/RimL family protein N-acetyltransferase